MKLLFAKDATDKSVAVFVADSSQTDGRGLSGLAYNTSNLVCYYVRPGAAAAALTLATQTVTGAHSDGGFVEVSSTNLPGVYRLDLSDAILATGADSAVVMLKGATNMVPCVLEIQLVDAAVGALTATERTTTADVILNRPTSNVESSVVAKSLGAAVMKLTHKVVDDGGGNLVVYKSNGSDQAYSQSILDTDASLEPIKELGGATAS